MGKMAIAATWTVLAAVVAVLFMVADGARRINVQEEMQLRARRSLYNGGEDIPRVMLGLTEGEDLEETTEAKTVKGTKKIKFQETFKGIKVAGATVVLEKDKNGRYSNKAVGSLVADLLEDIPSTSPQLSADEAFRMIILHNNDNLQEVRFNPDVDAILEVMLDDDEEDDGGRPHGRLMYKVSYLVEGEDEISRPFTLIDAISGEIVKQWNGLSMNKITKRKTNRVQSASEINGVGGNNKIGKVEYGKNYPKLKVDNACILENNVAKVFNCRRKTRQCDVSTPYVFDCKEGVNDAINGAYSPMSDALFYITATYEMFDQWYNIQKPLKHPGTNESMCMSRVHYGTRYENAFWDGTYITFGDGANRFYPLTSINVVAHEIAHGITEMNSGLIYSGESGGMNEAFSDMAGEAVEFFASKSQDWMVGYEIFKDPGGALRYFKDPKRDGKSIGTARDYCAGMDPHYSSGLFNRAFYYLGITAGWDVRSAFHPFVYANTLYWNENSHFFDAACGVVQAAKDLGLNATDVTAAFRKVGIEPCVDKSVGLEVTAGLKCPAGQELVLQVTITESMEVEHMTIDVRTGVEADVRIHSPMCNHCVEKVKSYGSRKFELCSNTTGVYQVSIVPVKDMRRGSVGFYGKSINVVQNATLRGRGFLFKTKFDMPKFVTLNDLQVMMKLTSRYGYVTGYLNHGEEPDLRNYEYDYRLSKNQQKVLCNAKPGTWYLTLKSSSSIVRNVIVTLQSILTGRKASQPTPPDTDNSGSGGSSSVDEFFI